MKGSKHRLLIIAIGFAVYNLLVFAIPFQRDAVFWIAYTFAALTILAQAAMDWLAFRNADTLKRMFLGIPIVKISFRCLCAQLFVCAVLMIVATFVSFSAWIAIVPCALIFAIAAVAIIKADWSREIIEKIDTKHLANTKFMHEFRTDLLSLLPHVSNGALKAKLEKLTEAMRYSDPVSIDGIAELEAEMSRQLTLLKQAILGDRAGDSIVEELLLMCNERNQKSRAMKRQQYQT